MGTLSHMTHNQRVDLHGLSTWQLPAP